MRSLGIIHQLIHIFGSPFHQKFQSPKIRNLFNLKLEKDNGLSINYSKILLMKQLYVENFIYSALCVHYNNYLQKLSFNYDDFILCFQKKPDSNIGGSLEIDITSFPYISKVQNILNYLIKVI